jgi:hypothetical protein
MKRLFVVAAALAAGLMSTLGDAAVTASAGSIPSGLPGRLGVGLMEGWGQTWMKSSGVPWDYRYIYFTKGWANNWGYGAYDGSMATNFFNECAAGGFVPAIQYYQMNLEAGGGEAQFLSKTQNAATMRGYFNDFKLLMQKAKAYGKPVVIVLEADGFGFLQQQANSNPNVYAAVADSGVPELAGLPNTIAGWGLAFLKLKSAVGASNVYLGPDISSWATNREIMYVSITDSLQPVVDQVYNFLAPFGLAANQTGLTFDFIGNSPMDRDSDYYRVVRGQNYWMDASDNASILTSSFNRYAEWLRLWNVKTNKRIVLWQIPLGNSNHLDVANNGGLRQGYKDNRPEYFFASGTTAHMEKFASSGVIAMLFGAGANDQSSYQNDAYTDGQLFMKSRAGNILKAGGVAVPGGTTTGGGTTTPPATDATDYNFEGDTQGWTSTGSLAASLSRNTSIRYAGNGSLAAKINGNGTAMVSVANPAAKAGQTVSFHIYVPSGAAISWVQPYVQQGASGNWSWTGNWRPMSALKAGAWNTISVTVPANAALLSSLGVQFATSGAYNGSVYVDSVNF